MELNASIPAGCVKLAQDLLLGRFVSADVEPHGRTLYRFQNGTALWHRGAFAGLLMRDAYNGYRFVHLRKDWVELALAHSLGSFQGTDSSAEGTTVLLFEYGSLRVINDQVESVLTRGKRVSGEHLVLPPRPPPLPQPARR
ncbi:MAG: hypothetical protein ACT4TC_17410 [Myxococcaceae bacterium]